MDPEDANGSIERVLEADSPVQSPLEPPLPVRAPAPRSNDALVGPLADISERRAQFVVSMADSATVAGQHMAAGGGLRCDRWQVVPGSWERCAHQPPFRRQWIVAFSFLRHTGVGLALRVLVWLVSEQGSTARVRGADVTGAAFRRDSPRGYLVELPAN